ncbi:MAG: MarR family winged helix-turn-helix transcriptional regulator [Sulfurifustaceae bacterium]
MAITALRNQVPRNGDADALDRGLLPSLIGYQLRLAQIAIFRDFKQALGKHDITPGLFGVLVLIDANAGMKQTDLAKAIHLDRSTVVNVIDNLEAMKLVERRASSGDRRSKALYLTSEGKRTLHRLKPLVIAHERRLKRHLSAADQKALVNLLQKIFPEYR